MLCGGSTNRGKFTHKKHPGAQFTAVTGCAWPPPQISARFPGLQSPRKRPRPVPEPNRFWQFVAGTLLQAAGVICLPRALPL